MLQTRFKIVVFPALALPITRIRKRVYFARKWLWLQGLMHAALMVGGKETAWESVRISKTMTSSYFLSKVQSISSEFCQLSSQVHEKYHVPTDIQKMELFTVENCRSLNTTAESLIFHKAASKHWHSAFTVRRETEYLALEMEKTWRIKNEVFSKQLTGINFEFPSVNLYNDDSLQTNSSHDLRVPHQPPKKNEGIHILTIWYGKSQRQLQ